MLEIVGERLEYGLYQIVSFLPQLLAALGILLVGYAVAKMLERHGGNVSAVARAAGVDRTVIYKIIERHQLKRDG